MAEWVRPVEFLFRLLRKQFMIHMSSHYESAYNLKKYISFIIDNKRIFCLEGPQMKKLENELRANNNKLDEYIQEITEKDAAIIQLYQTKRAATEILHFKKKYLKRLQKKGCLSRAEVADMVDVINQCTRKCEHFGFSLNNNHIKGALTRHSPLPLPLRKRPLGRFGSCVVLGHPTPLAPRGGPLPQGRFRLRIVRGHQRSR